MLFSLLYIDNFFALIFGKCFPKLAAYSKLLVNTVKDYFSHSAANFTVEVGKLITVCIWCQVSSQCCIPEISKCGWFLSLSRKLYFHLCICVSANLSVCLLSANRIIQKLIKSLETRSSADADKPARRVGGQSRSPNIVSFHMLGIVSYCAIVTLSLRRAVYTIFDFKKCRDLEMGSKVTQGHWEWYHSIDCVWFPISIL